MGLDGSLACDQNIQFIFSVERIALIVAWSLLPCLWTKFEELGFHDVLVQFVMKLRYLHVILCRYNRSMLLFSFIFLLSSLFLTRVFGSVGFILANCINMAARITHSCHFILTFFSSTPFRPLREALPSLASISAFAITGIFAALSEVR